MQKPLSVTPTDRETVFGVILLPFYAVLFQMFAIWLASSVFHVGLSAAVINACYYALNLLSVLLIFRDFLLRNLRTLRADRIPAAFVAFPIYLVLSTLVSQVILRILPDFQNRNNGTVYAVLDTSPLLMIGLSVIVAPLVEETLFRGLIFGRIRRKSRVLAYLITALCFSAIHVVGYLGLLSPLEIAASILQYVPASVVLCGLYEYSDNLIPPILLHAIINLVACIIGMAQ